MTKLNYFDLLHLPQRFDVSRAEVQQAYRTAMRGNPDATYLALAYDTLLDPVRRAFYLTTLHLPDFSPELVQDAGVLTPIWALREMLEGLEDPACLEDFLKHVEDKIRDTLIQLQATLEAQEISALPALVIHLRYLQKLREDVDLKREGR